MGCWIVHKMQNGKFIYVSGVDEYDNPIYTEDKSKACRFYDINSAMCWFNRGGYCVEKYY